MAIKVPKAGSPENQAANSPKSEGPKSPDVKSEEIPRFIEIDGKKRIEQKPIQRKSIVGKEEPASPFKKVAEKVVGEILEKSGIHASEEEKTDITERLIEDPYQGPKLIKYIKKRLFKKS